MESLETKDVFKEFYFEPKLSKEVEVSEEEEFPYELYKENEMSSIDLQSLGSGDGVGLGGGGVVTGLILGALLGRGGLGAFGGANDSTAALVNMATKDDIMQQTLGDIKASIPFNEAQVQLALAGAVASLTQQNTNNTQYLSGQNTAAALQAQTTAALITRDIAGVDTNVDRQSTAIQMAIKDDGERTRALITSNQIAELNQRLTVAQQEALELRNNNARDRDRHAIEINMTNNQNQNQLQFQQQNNFLTQLGHLVAAQNIRSTNSAINVGGTQLASPTNTNTNIG